MNELRKINSHQLYNFWKNLSMGLLTIIALIAFSILLPYYCSPIVALLAAALLYTAIYNQREEGSNVDCMLALYSVFFSLLCYSFISIIVNVLYVWGFIHIPQELTFFNSPYLPALWLDPICFATMFILYLRRRKLANCKECKLQNGGYSEKGMMAGMLCRESYRLLRNMMMLFGILSVICWGYYLKFYDTTNINARDRYIFMWLNMIAFLLDEIFFIMRYYNLYLDFKEHDELISPEDIEMMSSKTYLRYYVICDEDIYMNMEMHENGINYRTFIDTPFISKCETGGLTLSEINNIIKKMSGVDNGVLKFFYGRRLQDVSKRSIVRYFYFLKGTKDDYPELAMKGKWMTFDELKKIYSFNPGSLSKICVSDITRLATIVLTQKIFDEKGFRRNKLKSYQPTFSLKEIENSEIDFQDDKWIRISSFNSDTPFYRIKRWWRNRMNEKKFS